MAQGPFKVDQIQIEPGSAGNRIVRRAPDGSLEFLDAKIPGGITLSQLAGLRSIQNIMVVGKAGAGAAYTTVQAALDAIPSSSSQANPYFVIVGPGVYRETINVVRDGVHILGFGASIQSDQEANPNGVGAYHTIVIQAAQGSIPKYVVLENLEISNVHNNYACVRVAGGVNSQVAQAGLYIVNCHIRATAVGGNRTISAATANHIVVSGGTMRDCGALAMVVVDNCASFRVFGVDRVPACQFTANGAQGVPSESHLGYEMHGCPGVAVGTGVSPGITANLSNLGSIVMNGCTGGPTLIATGTQTVVARDTELSDVTLDGIAMLRVGGSRGDVSGANGASLREAIQRGSVAFNAAAVANVSFPVAHPDTEYTVSLELDDGPANNEVPWVTTKTTAGFQIHFSANQTLGVQWVATRVI